MEIFPNHSTVRLKSCQDNKYLVADKDEESVSQSRDGSTKNAHWTVEVVDDGCICLKSCYDKYLTASNKPSIPGMRARFLKVTQSLPINPNPNEPLAKGKSNSSLQWVPVTNDYMSQVRLKTLYGNYLQSNKGPTPLGNMVTHDLPRKEGPMNKRITWEVEVVELASDILERSDSFKTKMAGYVRTVKDKIKEKIIKPQQEQPEGKLVQQQSEQELPEGKNSSKKKAEKERKIVSK